MKYPDEKRMLVIRPCIKTICLNIKPAARLLAHLLYLARNCSEDEATFTVSCTQQEIIDGLIDEIDIKTLHRTAIPVLRLLGFLDVDGASYRYTYIVHLDLIQHCLEHCNNKEQLDKILIVSMQWQLDKYRIEIDKCPIELVKSPIDMDKCLIPFRQMSNSKRGRKPRPQAALEVVSENPDNKRDITDRLDNEESRVFTSVQTPRSYLEEFDDSSFEDEATVKQPAIKLNGALNGNNPHPTPGHANRLPGVPVVELPDSPTDVTGTAQAVSAQIAIASTSSQAVSPPTALVRQSQTPLPARVTSAVPPAMCETHEQPDGVATPTVDGSESRASGKDKPKRRKKPVEVQLTLHEQEVKEWYEELRGVEVSFSKKNVTALQALGKRTMTKDDFLNVTAILDSDTWFEEHKIGVDLYWIERQWENKFIFLQRRKPLMADKKPEDNPYSLTSLLRRQAQQAEVQG